MEARMGAFMIHHSEELIVSQHLGQGTGGRMRELVLGPRESVLLPLSPAVPRSPLKSTGPESVTPQPPDPTQGICPACREPGGGCQLTHNPQNGS